MNSPRLIATLTTLALLPAALSSVNLRAASPDLPNDFRLVYSQNFEGQDWLKQFTMTDPQAWRAGTISSGGENTKTLELFGKSNYKPPHRSPFNIAWIRNNAVGDFILDVNLLQTGREYGHRDMCLFFGYQDPAHFYYVHMATATDDHAHNIFIVNEAPRIKISERTTQGVQWGTKVWHHIRLVRKVGSGLIQVYYDDMNQPIMEATDTNFGLGHIGFGSFDDTGMVDNIKLWSNDLKLKPISGFH